MKTLILKSLNHLHKCETGQGLVEYLLILALVAFAATAGMTTLASGLNSAFTKIGSILGEYISQYTRNVVLFARGITRKQTEPSPFDVFSLSVISEHFGSSSRMKPDRSRDLFPCHAPGRPGSTVRDSSNALPVGWETLLER